MARELDFHVEGDLPGAPEYTNPDPDGDGFAANGKPVYSVERAVETLNRGGARWSVGGDGVITYSFLEHAPTGQYNNPKNYDFLGAYVEGFEPFTAEQRDAAREGIALWDDLIAPSFVEMNGRGADIVFMNTSTGPGQASAYTPFYGGAHGKYAKIQGDTFVNQEQPDNFDLGYGGYGQTALVHEIGHTLGLEHPGDYNAGDDQDEDGEPDPITYAGDAFYFQDSMQYTIMSYFHAENTGAVSTNWSTGFYHTPQTPMLHDIATVQALYGADPDTRVGDTIYGFNSTADRDVFDFTQNINPFLTIYDAGGHDTLDFSGWTRNSVLNLNDGEFSSGYGQVTPPAAELNAYWSALYEEQLGFPPNSINLSQATWNSLFANAFLSDNISIAYGTTIEDGITGSGHDRLIGNEIDNRLDGGAGQDTYTGGGGADTFVFGHAGNFDFITDFESGVDTIDLSDLGIGASAVTFGADRIFIDVNGNGTPDMAIVSQGDPIVAGDLFFG